MQLIFRGKPILKCAVAALISILMFGAVQMKAAPATAMTQVELIQWLVQLSGDTSTLPPNPQIADFVKWANDQGLTPAGGWDPSAVLSRDALAQVLIQFFGYTVKPGNDPYRSLKREGIDLGNDSTISRDKWILLVQESDLAANSLPEKAHSGWQPPPNHPVPPGNHHGWHGGDKPPGQQKPKPFDNK